MKISFDAPRSIEDKKLLANQVLDSHNFFILINNKSLIKRIVLIVSLAFIALSSAYTFSKGYVDSAVFPIIFLVLGLFILSVYSLPRVSYKNILSATRSLIVEIFDEKLVLSGEAEDQSDNQTVKYSSNTKYEILWDRFVRAYFHRNYYFLLFNSFPLDFHKERIVIVSKDAFEDESLRAKFEGIIKDKIKTISTYKTLLAHNFFYWLLIVCLFIASFYSLSLNSLLLGQWGTNLSISKLALPVSNVLLERAINVEFQRPKQNIFMLHIADWHWYKATNYYKLKQYYKALKELESAQNIYKKEDISSYEGGLVFKKQIEKSASTNIVD